MNTLWNTLAQAAGLTLDEQCFIQLSKYLDILLEQNKTMNLTRITDRAQAEVSHVGDALTVLPFLPQGAFRMADVGSGGGVPGIPLAIVRKDATITLVEATQKKAAFLNRAIGELGLTNVSVLAERAEKAGHTKLRESCDVTICRAVGEMCWIAEWCLPLVKKGGRVLAMKGPRVLDELPAAQHAIALVGGGQPKIYPVQLPGTDGLRMVEIPKIRPTISKYPRDAAATRGRPIS